MKFRKKLLAAQMSVVMLMGAAAVAPAAVPAAAATVAQEAVAATSGVTGGCTWRFNSSTGELTVSKSETSKMDSYGNAGDRPWNVHANKITTVTIERGVTYIGKNAFYNCPNLTTLSLGTVTEIDRNAFYMCKRLSDITFSKRLKTIGMMAFAYTAITGLSLPPAVEKVDTWAFSNCESLKSVTIPDGCTAVLDSPFASCTSLATVSIGNSVTEMTTPFSNCPVTKFTVSDDNPAFAVTGSFLCSKDLTRLVYYCNGSRNSTVTVPETVTAIGEEAFYWNAFAKTVNLPSKLTVIEKDAFNCASVATLSFPDTLEEIGIDAFNNTPWLNNQADGLVYAGKVAYLLKETAPKSVSVKAGTLGIAGGAFMRKTGLKTVTLPVSLTNIGEKAFYECYDLATARLPRKLKKIGMYAFASCTSFTELLIPNNVTELGDGCFACCTAATKLTLSENITEIPTECFDRCTALSGDILIPKSVKKIGDSAFSQCAAVNSFTLQNPSAEIVDYWHKTFGYGDNKRHIYGFKNSSAESYAAQHNWVFTAITEIRGDANFDGKVNVADVTAIQRAAAEQEALSPQAILNSDITHNSKADVGDATAIQRYCAEFTQSL